MTAGASPPPTGRGPHEAGVAAPVVLAATHEAVLDLVPLDALRQHAVDVPEDLSGLDT